MLHTVYVGTVLVKRYTVYVGTVLVKRFYRQGTDLDLKSVRPVYDILTCLLSGSHVLIW
jgi:hypothetical protein